jgi:hypothetical protein
MEINPCILSEQNAIKLELSNNRNSKYSNNWRPKNTLFYDQWLIKETRRKSKRSRSLMGMKA